MLRFPTIEKLHLGLIKVKNTYIKPMAYLPMLQVMNQISSNQQEFESKLAPEKLKKPSTIHQNLRTRSVVIPPSLRRSSSSWWSGHPHLMSYDTNFVFFSDKGAWQILPPETHGKVPGYPSKSHENHHCLVALPRKVT